MFEKKIGGVEEWMSTYLCSSGDIIRMAADLRCILWVCGAFRHV